VIWPALIRPQAQADLDHARLWYNTRRPGLGNEFVIEIREALAVARNNPQRYAVYYRDFRRILVKRFPYKIFYRFERERIIVFRVLHVRQDHTERLA